MPHALYHVLTTPNIQTQSIMVQHIIHHSTFIGLMTFTNGKAYDNDDIKPCTKERVKSSVWEKRYNMCYSTQL